MGRGGEEKDTVAMLAVGRGGCPGWKRWVPAKPKEREEAGREENERRRDPQGGKKLWDASREWGETEGGGGRGEGSRARGRRLS